MGQNPIPLVNIKIAGKWMFIPLKMVLIGIDPYPYMIYVTVLLCRHDATRSDPFLIISTCWKGTPAVSPQWCPLANAKWPAMTGKWHGRHKPVWHGMTLSKYYEYTWSTIESEPSNTIFRNLGKKQHASDCSCGPTVHYDLIVWPKNPHVMVCRVCSVLF